MALKLNPKIPKKLHDFRNFMTIIWEGLNLPQPTPVQYDIAFCMQHGVPDFPDKLIVEAFRGIGKSYIAVAYTLFCLYHDPDYKIMVVSASKLRADDFSMFAHKIIETIPLCQHMKGGEGQSWSHVKFDVAGAKPSGSPSVKSVGITGQLTGSRADLIIADDVETPGNSMTQIAREKLRELVKEFDAVKKPGGRILYLGTPQCEASLYNALEKTGFPIKIWPAEYPSPEEMSQRYGHRLAVKIRDEVLTDASLVGHSTDPKRFSDEDLMSRKFSYGRSGYALQFMLDTTLSDADRHPLRISDLIVMSCDLKTAPDNVIYGIFNELKDLPNVAMPGDRWFGPQETIGRSAYDGVILAIDPSGRGQDETGYAIIGCRNGILYLMKAGGRQGTGYSPENLTFFAELAQTHKVTNVIVESNFGDGMFTALFEPVLLSKHSCSIEEIRHNTQKEARIIDTLEPVINQHRLVIDPKVIQYDYESVSHLSPEKAVEYMLFYQFTRITRDKGSLAHDDRLDAVAIAVRYWTDILNLDAAKEVNDAHEKEKLAWMQNLEKTMRGDVNLSQYSTSPIPHTYTQTMDENDVCIVDVTDWSKSAFTTSRNNRREPIRRYF